MSKWKVTVVAAVLTAAGSMLPSVDALNAVKSNEGVRTSAYLDPVGVPTICYGGTRGVFLGQKATLAECEVMLKEDAGRAGAAVTRLVTHKLTQPQYDALVDFVYNVGEGSLARSTLLRKINAGDCFGAGAEFSRWVYAGKVKLPGLVRRRESERLMWVSGCYLW